VYPVGIAECDSLDSAIPQKYKVENQQPPRLGSAAILFRGMKGLALSQVGHNVEGEKH
jgi:hypothetical protein